MKGRLQISIWGCACKLAWVQYDENSWQRVYPHTCGSGCYSHTSKSNPKMPENQSGTKKRLPPPPQRLFVLTANQSRALSQVRLSQIWFIPRLTCVSLGCGWYGERHKDLRHRARRPLKSHGVFDLRLWLGWRSRALGRLFFIPVVCVCGFFFLNLLKGKLRRYYNRKSM